MILPLLLHHANRVAKDYAYTQKFYVIKDLLLKRGIKDGYDIQHIRGKYCNSCGGTGVHEKYSMYPPYKVYDTDGCWHCNASGFYKMPMWICLQRVKFGSYNFHQPMKREFSVQNPFTEKNMGWRVTDGPVIEGYVQHRSSSFGLYALLILFWMYDRNSYRELFRDRVYHLKLR